jgi:hypothetical protein
VTIGLNQKFSVGSKLLLNEWKKKNPENNSPLQAPGTSTCPHSDHYNLGKNTMVRRDKDPPPLFA